MKNGFFKKWYIDTIEYYSVVKKKLMTILKFSGKLMDLEKPVLSEVTHTQKDKYSMYSLISGF